MNNRVEDVLERKVMHAGKPFIKAGEEHARAYMIQNGEVLSYVMDGDRKIEVARYGPGSIIGETCLMIDQPMTMNYEAVVDSTVVTITRQDFQKKIQRLDKNVATILNQVMNKLNYQDSYALEKARQGSQVDPDALRISQMFTASLPDARKFAYEKAILPHLNEMIKAIKALKEKEAERAGD